MRMDAQTEASDAGRALAQTRWANAKVRRALTDLAENDDQIDLSQRAALAWLAIPPKERQK